MAVRCCAGLALVIASRLVVVEAFGQPYPPSAFGEWDPSGPIEVRDPNTPADPVFWRALQPVHMSLLRVLTPQAAQIARVTLVRLGACTHGYDQNTRFYEFPEIVLPMGGGKVRVQAPPNGNHAPPGYYMLFITTNGDRGGIFYPSVAKMIKLKA